MLSGDMSKQRVLVVGGCGFIGYHIVRALMQQPAWSVHVMSRNPTQNLVDGVQYHTGTVLEPEKLQAALTKIQPTLIIHAASPTSAGNSSTDRLYQETNVKGTRNLLDAAASSGCVKAFIYTSSADILQASSSEFATEEAPTHTANSRGDVYAKSKAVADQMVLNANGRGGMRTVCLRPGAVYGERDGQVIAGFLQQLRQGSQRYQIGDNTNLFDFTSVANVAQAHILAAKALLSDSTTGVDGEAFFITDGHPSAFWSFARKVWSAAGDKTRPEEVTVVPAWLMLALASLVDWIYWVVTLGYKRPQVFRRSNMNYACLPWTFSIDKARQRLGYTPVDDRDEQIQNGVEWALRTQADAAHKRDQ